MNHPMDCQAVLDLQQANDDSENPQDLMWIYKHRAAIRMRIEGYKDESLKEIVMVEDTLVDLQEIDKALFNII